MLRAGKTAAAQLMKLRNQLLCASICALFNLEISNLCASHSEPIAQLRGTARSAQNIADCSSSRRRNIGGAPGDTYVS